MSERVAIIKPVTRAWAFRFLPPAVTFWIERCKRAMSSRPAVVYSYFSRGADIDLQIQVLCQNRPRCYYYYYCTWSSGSLHKIPESQSGIEGDNVKGCLHSGLEDYVCQDMSTLLTLMILDRRCRLSIQDIWASARQVRSIREALRRMLVSLDFDFWLHKAVRWP